MPVRTEIPDLTGPELNIHRIVQNESRLSCLRALLGAPSASRPELQEATGLQTTTIVEALTELEERGYISANRPKGDRAGSRAVRYVVHRERVTGDLLALAGWILR